MLIQVDGPGKTQILEKLAEKLDPVRAARPGEHPLAGGWTAVWFDAWQHQRVAPPWWWLMSALDKQIRERCRRLGRWQWLRQRGRDYGERAQRLAKDLLWVVPGALLVLIGWQIEGARMVDVLKWLLTAAGGIAALLALVSSLLNALRRHVLVESPVGTTALLRTTDPMEDLLRRYAFLVDSARTDIIVLIDNLDRCKAEYVVEMLEGIQTLLRSPKSIRPGRPCPLLAFVVAADRGWLCDSYLHVYSEFETSVREPGRPFGLMFLDKIFDVALRVPTVSAAAAGQASRNGSTHPHEDPFGHCENERQVRIALRAEEQAASPTRQNPPPPVPALRIAAVKRLSDLELNSASAGRRQCTDTAQALDQLLEELEPGLAVQRQLDTAYCVKRTIQLLAGHELDSGKDAIYKLGLWTVLELKWPLLASHLARRPADMDLLEHGAVPDDIDPDLKQLFNDPFAQRLADDFPQFELTERDVLKFTQPLRPVAVMPEPVPA